MVDVEDPPVRRDRVDRAPHRGQRRVVRRVVEVVAALPPRAHSSGSSSGAAAVLGQRSAASPPPRRRPPPARPRTSAAPSAPSSAAPDHRRERAGAGLGVVEADHRRPEPALHDGRAAPSTPPSSDGSATASKRRCAGSGISLTVTRVMTPERALRADEELRQLRADRVARHRHGVDDLAGRRDDPQRDEQVLDLPVARGEHARAARRDVAADRRPLGRGGEVREGEPALVEQLLEGAAVVAGLDGRGERLLVDLDDRGPSR